MLTRSRGYSGCAQFCFDNCSFGNDISSHEMTVCLIVHDTEDFGSPCPLVGENVGIFSLLELDFLISSMGPGDLLLF